MGLVLKNLETISLSDKLSTSFATEICEDGRISLLTENNVYVYTLTNYMDNEFSDMAFKKKMIHLPKSSLRDEFEKDLTELFDDIGGDDLNQFMAELDINNCLEFSASTDIKPLALKWGPKGLQGNSFCVLAVLTNLYGLSIMVECRDETDSVDFCCISNVTKYIVEQASKEWDSVSEVIGELSIEEWKERALSIRPIAFEWSHLINNSDETYAILFVAHPSGSITSWKFTKISRSTLESKPLQLEPVQFVGMFISSLVNVSSMYWKKLGGNVGALFLGNDEGKLSVLRVSNMNTETLVFEEEIFGIKETKRRVNYITSIEYNRFTFIVIAFEAFLSIILILEDGNILDEVSYNTGTMATTGLCHFKKNILLLLTGEKLRQLTLNVEDDKIQIKDENVSVDFDGARFRSCGLVLSRNRIFLGILAHPCRLKDITRHPTPSKFFIYHDTAKIPLKMILENTEKSIADYWDCFEVLRMISLKEKKFPWEGIDNLDYDKLTITQLKSLRLISKLSEKVYNIIPQIKGYNIKPYILLHYLVTIQIVVQRMRRLLNDLCQGKQLSLFQMQSLDISNMYLKEMVLLKILEKCKVGERFVDDIIGVMELANELEYPDMPACFWCQEKIIGPNCLPPHKDSRCVISMMQIYLTPGYKCPLCGCVAHIEMEKEYDIVTCPYCDVPMYERYSSKNVQNALEKTDVLTRRKMELSLMKDVPKNIDMCFDGDVEEDDTLDVVENAVDYLAVSDSDEEEINKERMTSLYNELFDVNKTSSDRTEMIDDLEGLNAQQNDHKGGNYNDETREDDSSEDQAKEDDSSDDQLKENDSSDDQEEEELES
ncbi:uncharacterized protein LOC123321596 [Coccinella septempunctata]|uniref:uncharacterized protein LOC123321596 n=1 Tax=Coccinella septempunctata TaxID=41139 RepID=UPI001D08D392|nr:uncharacterized protein LOC123321596 [Coccinella septempunctata]